MLITLKIAKSTVGKETRDLGNREITLIRIDLTSRGISEVPLSRRDKDLREANGCI
jgi:hypothetical protein